jgi:hypothetical protein
MKRILLRRINYYHLFVSGLHTARSGVLSNICARVLSIVIGVASATSSHRVKTGAAPICLTTD